MFLTVMCVLISLLVHDNTEGLVSSQNKFGFIISSQKQFGFSLVSPRKKFNLSLVSSQKKFGFGLVPTQKKFGFGLVPTQKKFGSSSLPTQKKFGFSLVSPLKKLHFNLVSTQKKFGFAQTSFVSPLKKFGFGLISSRKNSSRITRKSRSTKLPVVTTTMTTREVSTVLTTEPSVFPWNSWQYYGTVGPVVDPVIRMEFLRCPLGKEPSYYYPNRTAEEHAALVAERKGRANKTGWCQCGYCPQMTTDEDSLCCREDWYFNRSVNTMNIAIESGYNETTCWSNSELTDDDVLNKTDLERYRVHFLTRSKRHLEILYKVDFRKKTQQLWRWLGYRYLIRGVNMFTPWDLGRFNRTVPACLVDRVRKAYPDPNGKYPDTGWSVFGPIRLPG